MNVYLSSPIGLIKITEAEGFVTGVNFVDGEDDEPVGESAVLATAVLQLQEYFAGKRQIFDFPFRQQGSTFQQAVWDSLMQINYGTTISYLQQSQRMGNPLAIRANAASNGKNNIAIVVACHRVIGSDGSLTGYASGVWRKKWLLEHEAKVSGIGQTRIEF